MTTYDVGIIVGSISSTSINRRLARALTVLAPEAGLRLTEIPIRSLPMYSADHDAAIPAEAAEFKRAIEASDAIIVVTPEYNRSVPGVLKNALDTASRPWGDNSLAGKPTAVIGMSIGTIGTAASQQHLRNILAFLAAPTLTQPEAYLQIQEGLITDDGTVTDVLTAEFLMSWLVAAREHFERARPALEPIPAGQGSAA
ncbi:NADPH-dependent FMN reductase [Auraticoccus monumenti]|uniref:NAD(P)H-dependent FMN reductase n=1 Tax=Auraticoccus monumenti TaxID=675864 RepID=A0A1G7A0X2_9ACTN|nr:NADPH-dependent FMN reductase [Auraticoccus monumenti]SDE08472.1 NAD(P)H-dependent FMN reductase [Auraticoccus monumenti]